LASLYSDFALKIHFQQISFERLDEKQTHFPFLNSGFFTKFLRLFIKFRTSNCVQRSAALRSGGHFTEKVDAEQEF